MTKMTQAERRRAKRVPLELRASFRYGGFRQGDLISVALPSVGLVRAAVQWCRNGMFAAQFQRAVDIRACFRP